jgi:hypothetical protein
VYLAPGGGVNYFQTHEVIFSEAFSGGVLGKTGVFVVFGWTKRGALLVKTWWIDGRFVARENMPAF